MLFDSKMMSCNKYFLRWRFYFILFFSTRTWWVIFIITILNSFDWTSLVLIYFCLFCIALMHWFQYETRHWRIRSRSGYFFLTFVSIVLNVYNILVYLVILVIQIIFFNLCFSLCNSFYTKNRLLIIEIKR